MKNTAYPSSSQPAQEATSRPARHATKMASIPHSASLPGGHTPAPQPPRRANSLAGAITAGHHGRRFIAT
jgi:hypothetical protein